MPLFLPTDMNVFFDTVDGFATPITLFPGLPNQTIINGIFQEDAAEYDLEGGMFVNSEARPYFIAPTALVPFIGGPTEVDLTIRGVSYVALQSSDDGFGFTKVEIKAI
jgi:hypothetical protein